jgi:DUF4097 and DUF4098 domain-containing protein YvlB/outer membrane biosynthesis protein TonB
MPNQNISVGNEPRVVITRWAGDLKIERGEEGVVDIESSYHVDVQQSEEALVLQAGRGDLDLRVPASTIVLVERVEGDMVIREVRAANVGEANGDVKLEQIDGDVRLGTVRADLRVERVESLIVGHIRGDGDLKSVGTAKIERVDGDFELEEAHSVTVGNIGGDCHADEVSEVFRYGNIGGDFSFEGSSNVDLSGGSVGGDASVRGSGTLQLSDVGGDAHFEQISGRLHLGSIGGDCNVERVSGDATIGNVGGDARVTSITGLVRIGNVGGDLKLDSGFPPESNMQITVGGDASIALPDQANLTIRATVGGEVSGNRLVSSGGGMFTVVYGDGSAQLHLIVGGDLDLEGAGSPKVSNSSWSGWGEDFGREMGRWGEEFGREMGRWGEEFGREMGQMFSGQGERWGEKAQERAERVSRRVTERMREVDERVRQSTERAASSDPQSSRMSVRMGDREWRFDPERIERLKRQAEEAAREGVSEAMNAMERALAGLGAAPRPPVPPVPPQPSVAPAPHVPPVAPQPPVVPQPSVSPQPQVPPVPPVPPHRPGEAGGEQLFPATGDTISFSRTPNQPTESAPQGETAQSVNAQPRNIEAERSAILQMVAEGRISPEEGDMLLEALG